MDFAKMMGKQLRLPKVQAALKGMLLLGLGIFLLTRITSGTLNYYISQRFDWLTVAAIMGLILVAGSYRYLLRGDEQGSAGPDSSVPERAGEADSAAGEDNHDHSHTLGWAGFGADLASNRPWHPRASPSSGRGGAAES